MILICIVWVGCNFDARPEKSNTKNMKIRKQVYKLTVDDLREHPVWEFALDEEGEKGQDEATVRPFVSSGSVDPRAGMFVVRARFTLADGTPHVGYLTPGDDPHDLGTIQPQIITEQGQVAGWGLFSMILSPSTLGSASRLSRLFPYRSSLMSHQRTSEGFDSSIPASGGLQVEASERDQMMANQVAWLMTSCVVATAES
jgi:hypothetical protein